MIGKPFLASMEETNVTPSLSVESLTRVKKAEREGVASQVSRETP